MLWSILRNVIGCLATNYNTSAAFIRKSIRICTHLQCLFNVCARNVLISWLSTEVGFDIVFCYKDSFTIYDWLSANLRRRLNVGTRLLVHSQFSIYPDPDPERSFHVCCIPLVFLSTVSDPSILRIALCPTYLIMDKCQTRCAVYTRI